MNAKRLIVVLGMHRSGTSAVTRGLQVMGVELGDRMMPPVEGNNPKGFWEDIDLNVLNIQMLAAVNRDWNHLTPFGAKEVEIMRNEGYFLRAVELLRQKVDGVPVFGFKDPRVAKLLPFWKEVFGHCKFNVNYILAIRNPLSVVKSLAKRDGLANEQSYLLWLGHVITSLIDSADSKRVLVDYDRLMQSPDLELTRIATCLDLEISTAKLQSYTTGFIDQGLRHTVYELNDLFLDKACPPVVREVYGTLLDVAADQVTLDERALQSKVSRWSDEFERIKPSLMLVDSLFTQKLIAIQAVTERDGQIASLSQAVTERDGQIASLSQAASERDGQIASLNQAVTERDGQIASLGQAVTERDGQIASLSQAVSERDGQLSSLGQAVTERDGQITSLNQAVTERDGQIASLGQAVSDARRELALVLASKSWQITKPIRFARRVVLTRPHAATRRILSDNSRALWRALPLSSENKRALKGSLFKTFPWVFRWSKAYQAWDAFNAPINHTPTINVTGRQLIEHGDEYVPLLEAFPLEQRPAKLICFYLPQFHAIPENDEWWGEGFTEWTNVQPAQPQFQGHYQPHVPGELGYYNLLDSAVQRRQVELAKLYGVEGFCFYFYWFGGKRLLEAPIENYLADKTLDLPFCLCWANENWSRRWDGLDSEILMAQQHSVEDDLAFIQHVARYMRDPRYIRINGKPLLVVYRPSLLPSAKETASRWRDWCLANGIGEIYLAYTQSFENVAPARYGFDAAIEFPPNNSTPPNITGEVGPIGEGFGSTVYDWRVFVERSAHYKQQPYTLFRGVCPAWDNTARRKNRGTVFLNSTPKLYQRWLENAIRDTRAQRSNPDERLIFVNAWNEWAEGAHLEPDARYGYAYLQATHDALVAQGSIARRIDRRIVLVAHDAYPHGAQFLAVNLARTLKTYFGFAVDLVCLGDGPLKNEYARWATLHDLAEHDSRGPEARALARRLAAQGHRGALANTTVSGLFVETLSAEGIESVCLIHELGGVLKQYRLEEHAEAIVRHARKIVFPAEVVRDAFSSVAPAHPRQTEILPQGLYKVRDRGRTKEADARALREQLGLPRNARIVLGAGYADHRKGIDLFVEAGVIACSRERQGGPIYWVWIGHWEARMEALVQERLKQVPALRNRFVFPGLQTDTDLFFGGADLMALTSREDPFPSIVMEAMDAGTPVVGFADSGGSTTLIEEGGGALAPMEDSGAFADAVLALLADPDELSWKGALGQEIIRTRYTFNEYVFGVLEMLGVAPRKVSVVVPNYNYERYLEARLDSILKQDYPIFEIIFLDDASQDGSVPLAQGVLRNVSIPVRFVCNENNSGSVFAQWAKGVSLARGDYVWIAEADDVAEHGFLSEAVRGFEHESVVLSYCESQQIDESGMVLAPNYHDYVRDLGLDKWLQSYVSRGVDEVHRCMAVRNTIPNVSGVVFRRQALVSVLDSVKDEVLRYRVAGDWLIYLRLLEMGDVAFSAQSLNLHRRHQKGMTIGSAAGSLIKEIEDVQGWALKQFACGPQVARLAGDYLATLRVQFGIEVE